MNSSLLITLVIPFKNCCMTKTFFMMFTDVLRLITCRSWIYCSHHFRAAGHELLECFGINIHPCAWNIWHIISETTRHTGCPVLLVTTVTLMRSKSSRSGRSNVCVGGRERICAPSPAGMRESVLQVTLLWGVPHFFVSGASGQECPFRVHMNKCSPDTFPHVTQEGFL